MTIEEWNEVTRAVYASGERYLYVTPQQYNDLQGLATTPPDQGGFIGSGRVGNLLGLSIVVDAGEAIAQARRMEEEVKKRKRNRFLTSYHMYQVLDGYAHNMKLHEEFQMPSDDQILKSIGLMRRVLEMTEK